MSIGKEINVIPDSATEIGKSKSLDVTYAQNEIEETKPTTAHEDHLMIEEHNGS